MSTDETCRACGRELTGAIETTLVNQGEFVEIASRETEDCNWQQCKGCKKILCKQCYSAEREYCCEEGRIVDRERAQLAIVSPDRSSPDRPPSGV